ncbi:MAG: T9SS type A sorting domain-containing protein [Bacteroidia bacterium]
MKQNITILMFILCLSNYFTKAQNLVSNGYFEINDTCPNNQYQITYATGWLNAGGTPDYFNACATINSGFNVPNTVYEYQQDCCNGNGFSGIYTSSASGNNTDREYIQIKLSDSLITGHKYLSTMYVNRSRSEGWAIATMGMFFSDSVISVPSSLNNFINVPNPQIKNTTILKDTVNWIMVQDTFIAMANEKYLVIGNFSIDSLSDTLKIITNGAYYFQAYYYVDGASVYEIDGTCNTYWDAGYDKYIKAGDSIRLGTINTDNSVYNWQNSLSGATYLSSNNDARPWSKPTQTTTYYVTKICPNNNVFYDTVTVYIQTTASIKTFMDDKEIRVYPNPAKDKIYVEGKNILEIKLSDLLGSKIISTKEQGIDVSGLNDGVYFITINADKNTSIQKIIIQH